MFDNISEHVRIVDGVSTIIRGPGRMPHDGRVPSASIGGRVGRPPLTSREEILAAARRVIDSDGWQRLTIRRLAAELGVGAATVYHHVQDREDLLIQLLDSYADESMRTRLPSAPRERIVAATIAIHDTLAHWPWAAEVVAADGFLGRLSGSAVAMVEAIVAGAVECGATPAQATTVFRSLWYYTVGEILVRTRSDSSEADREARAPAFTDFDPEATPTLAAIGPRWLEFSARDTFAVGVDAFVDGLLSRIADDAG